MGYYEAKYPQAQSEYTRYSEIASSLREQYSIIYRAGEKPPMDEGVFVSDAFSGAYYDAYVKQMQLWRQDAIDIQEEFKRVAFELDSRIKKAENKRMEWDAKRRETVYVEDEEDE